MHPAHKFFRNGARVGACFIVSVTGLVSLATFVTVTALGYSAADVVVTSIFCTWMAMIASLMMSMIFVRDTRRWVVSCLGKLVPACMPVLMTDFQGERYYSLAWERDGEWTAPVFFGTDVGQVYLNANGSCGKRDCGYVYLWEPVRQSDRAYFFLLNIDHPNEKTFAEWNILERSDWVSSKRKEIGQ